MQAAKRVAINTGFLYAKMGITVFISLYTTRIILDALGAKDFGLFNLVGGTIAMLGFLNASMASATQRFMSFAQGAGDFVRLKQIFNVSIVLHLIIAGLLLIILELAGYFFFNGILNIPDNRIEAAKLVYHFMVISTLFTITSVPYDAVINARENMLLFAVLGVIEALLKMGIAVYIANTTYDHLIIYGLLMATLSIFLLIFRRVYCHKKYSECRINFQKYFSKSIFKEMSAFAGWSFLGSSASMLSYYGQGIVMNIFFGPIVNAAQGVANQVSGQLNAFSVTMLKAFNPTIAKSEGAGERSKMLKASAMGSKVSFFLLVVFYIPVLIEMPFIFKLWLKEIPDFTVVFCRLLLLSNLIKQCFITLNTTILAVGNIRKYQLYFSILTFFTLPVSYLLFMLQYPAYSLYFVFMIYSMISAGFTLFFAKKNCGLSITLFLRNVVLKCLIIFIIMMITSLIPTLFLAEGIKRLILVSFISTAAFFVTAYFYGFTSEERNSISQMIKPAVNKFFLKANLLKRSFLNSASN